MKTKIKVEKEVEIKTLHVEAKVRYWEDSEVNGEPDTENGDNIPCKVGEIWELLIDVDSGKITNWTKGVTASIHYKVCDCCAWEIKDENGEVVMSVENEYVPGTLCPKEQGYGDYIIMDINEDGLIEDWEFDIDDFIGEE